MSAKYSAEVRGQRSEGCVHPAKDVPLTSDLGPLTFSPRALRRALRATLLAATVAGLYGCEWFSDFKRQPSIVTWESLRTDSLMVRGNPQGSVPTGGSLMPGYTVSYSPGIATIDSMSSLANLMPVSEASLAAGRKLFQINCAVCHGDKADGKGAATRYLFPGISLVNDLAKGRSDGYIFGMMRNGRGLMPSYNRIEEMDRWDVVNYLRALQGQVIGIPFETGPLARPGVAGDKLPGPSRLGPTRAIPFRSDRTPDAAAASATRPGGGA